MTTNFRNPARPVWRSVQAVATTIKICVGDSRGTPFRYRECGRAIPAWIIHQYAKLFVILSEDRATPHWPGVGQCAARSESKDLLFALHNQLRGRTAGPG
jgi:hypothetical protein